MPLPFTFEYTLPCYNHVTQNSSVTYRISAIAHDDGLIQCKYPNDKFIVNHERMYRDVTEKAERVMDGHRILETVRYDDEDKNIYAILLLILITILPC